MCGMVLSQDKVGGHPHIVLIHLNRSLALLWASLWLSVKNMPGKADAGDHSSIPRSGEAPWEENTAPTQASACRVPRTEEPGQPATVCGVAKILDRTEHTRTHTPFQFQNPRKSVLPNS